MHLAFHKKKKKYIYIYIYIYIYARHSTVIRIRNKNHVTLKTEVIADDISALTRQE